MPSSRRRWKDVLVMALATWTLVACSSSRDDEGSEPAPPLKAVLECESFIAAAKTKANRCFGIAPELYPSSVFYRSLTPQAGCANVSYIYDTVYFEQACLPWARSSDCSKEVHDGCVGRMGTIYRR